MRKLSSVCILFYLMIMFVGCSKERDVVDISYVEVTEIPIELTPEVEDDTALDTEETNDMNKKVSLGLEDVNDYTAVDMTLNRPMSKLYTYITMDSFKGIQDIVLSKDYVGLYEVRVKDGKKKLYGPDFTPIEYPKSKKYKVLEPFVVDDAVYFRVEGNDTDWIEIEDACGNQVYSPLGDYGVVDKSGKFVLKFGMYDYIGRYVENKARAYSKLTGDYYIIDVKGVVLKTYTADEAIIPYKLYEDDYVYLRRDKPNHSHALESLSGEVVIPYGVYKDNIHPKYLGEGVFVVNGDELLDGSMSGVVLYGENKEDRKLSKESYDVFDGKEEKYITGVITNGLVGPLAEWEYVVTDYEGKVLIEQGKYTFAYGGWTEGYALAKNKNSNLVLLDADCKEVKLPQGMQLLGRYAQDRALFLVKVTEDFHWWSYDNVPNRYLNPIGVVDKDFNWVILPGEFEYIKNLPIATYTIPCEYSKDGQELSSYMCIKEKKGSGKYE